MAIRTFIGSTDLNWFNAQNWQELIAPVAADNITIDLSPGAQPQTADVSRYPLNGPAYANTILVKNASLLQVDGGGVLNVASAITLAQAPASSTLMVVNTGGQVTVFGGNGPINVDTGSVLVLGGAAVPVALGAGFVHAQVSLAAGGFLLFNTTDNFTFSSLVGGSGGVNVSGPGKATLTGENFYGDTLINAGATLQIGDGRSRGSLGFGNVIDNGTLAFNRSGASVISNSISGSGDVSFSGGGQYIIFGLNDYTGRTSVADKTTLSIGNSLLDASIGSGDIDNNGVINLSGTAPTVWGGRITGTGRLIINKGVGGLPVTLGSTNSYSGGTELDNAALIAGASNVLGTGDFKLESLFNLAGFDQYVGGLASIGSGSIDNLAIAPVTLTLGGSGDSVYYGSILNTGGALSIVKTGAGNQALAGTGGFTGNVTINQGTLTLASSTAYQGQVAFAAGAAATLAFGANIPTDNLVSGFASGDALDFTGVTLAAGDQIALISGAGGVQTWALRSAGVDVARFRLLGSYNSLDFTLVADRDGGAVTGFRSYAARASLFNGGFTSSILWFNANVGLALDWAMQDGRIVSSDNKIAAFAPGSGWSLAGRADINGDGTTDVLLNFTAGGQTTIGAWLVRNGTYLGFRSLGGFATNSGWAFAGAGDFNGDGTQDVLLSNTSGGASRLSYWRVLNGAVQQTVSLNMGFSTDWSVVGTGDFNGDGGTDVLLRNSVSGAVADWTVDQGVGKTFTVLDSVAPGNGWAIDGVGDFNGDGYSDVLWRNGASVEIWNVKGGALDARVKVNAAAPTGFAFKAIGDYFGDGVSDILWQNAASGAIQIWGMSNDQVTQTSSLGGPGASSGWGIVG